MARMSVFVVFVLFFFLLFLVFLFFFFLFLVVFIVIIINNLNEETGFTVIANKPFVVSRIEFAGTEWTERDFTAHLS